MDGRCSREWKRGAILFGSYHVAFHKNAPATSLEMGHDNPEQLFQNYRSLVKPKDAARFRKLSPSRGASEKIVSMTA